MSRNRNRFSIRLKLVLLVTVLAIITYSVSALFIAVLYDYFYETWGISERTFIFMTLSLGIIWSGILAYIFARFITNPLEKLEEAATKAAKGDLRHKIDIPSSDDEIRLLSIAFHTMMNNLKETVKNINYHFQTTNESVIAMKETAEHSAKITSQITAAVADISDGSEYAATAVQHTSASVQEATKLAKEVQMKAQQSRKKSTEMVKTLENSQNVVNQLVKGIQRLASDQEKSLQNVNRLNQNALQVESIVTMVGDIAEQTNLLALNASIEAARAGEEGSGFAVVAEEVRVLADESAQAVQQISSLISMMLKDVTKVVGEINENVHTANTEAGKGIRTNEVIEQMGRAITEVVDEIEMISQLVDQQLSSIQSTGEQAEEVAAIAEETSAASEQVNASVQEQASTIQEVDQFAQKLAQDAKNLEEHLKEFKINES